MLSSSSSSSCPFLTIFFETSINQFNERIQQFVFSKPRLADPVQLHTVDSLMVYQGVVHQAILESLNDKPKGISGLYDPVARWKASKSVLKDYYEWLYRTQLVKSGMYVPIEDYGKFYEDNDHVDRDLPSVVYLDRGGVFNFTVYLSLDLPDVHNAPLDSLWMTIDVSDVALIEVLVTRIVNYLTNHVIYQVQIQDKGMFQQQVLPGLRLHPASVLLQAWNSAFKCTQYTDMNEEELQVGHVIIIEDKNNKMK
ncbi:cation channel sperm-associated protein subunit gamma 1-like [Amphiura filiformis]|uniref:cation channel sperm-associated protein subunit gamma 1-like n=1 Tax=Amphiura filiformis TaxID=82378 RepID=UPI003B21CBFD